MSAPESLWRRLGPGDAARLKTFLLGYENYAAGFSGRLIRNGELCLSKAESGGVLGRERANGLMGAVLLTPSGTIFPIFMEAPSPDEAARLRRFFQGRDVHSVIGSSEHVLALEDALGMVPRIRVAYRSMFRPVSEPLSEAPAPDPKALARTADPRDLSALFPLHAAYEKEEVLTEIHHFDAGGSRASLRHFLGTEAVVMALLDGRVIASARTNARGFRTWQIGGVYTVPDFRGRGWARYVVAFLLGLLSRSGKSASLFVKEGNTPALTLYHSMGFRDEGPYSVDYL